MESTFLVSSSVGGLSEFFLGIWDLDILKTLPGHGKPIKFHRYITLNHDFPTRTSQICKKRRLEWSAPISLTLLIGGTYSRRPILVFPMRFVVQNKLSEQIQGPPVVIGFTVLFHSFQHMSQPFSFSFLPSELFQLSGSQSYLPIFIFASHGKLRYRSHSHD